MNAKLLSTTFLGLALLLGTPLSGQELHSERVVISLSQPTKPGKLKLQQSGGSIYVLAHDGEDVIIEMNTRKNRNPSATVGGEGGYQSANTGMSLRIREEENTVFITNKSGDQIVDFTIRVPRNFSLTLNNKSRGTVKVEQVSGEMEIENNAGNIYLYDVTGSAVVSSWKGNIEVGFAEVAPNTPMAFATHMGNLLLELPEKTQATLLMSTDQGSLITDFNMVFVSKKNVGGETADAHYSERKYERWTIAKINGGGPEFRLKTSKGNIKIRKRN